MAHGELIDRIELLLDQLASVELVEEQKIVIAEIKEKLQIIRGYSHN